MLRRRSSLIALIGSTLAACAGEAPEQGPPPANATPAVAHARPAFTQLAARAGGFVSSVDAEGMPQFIWAIDQQAAEPTNTAQQAADFHLRRFAPALGLRTSDLETADLQFLRDMGEGGWIAEWKQRIDGVEVYPSEVTLLMKKNLDLVAISGRLRRANPEKTQFELTPEAALALALQAHLGVPLSPEDFAATEE